LFSRGPGRLVELVPIDLPRPRDPHLPRLRSLHERLSAHLRQQAGESEFSSEELHAMAPLAAHS